MNKYLIKYYIDKINKDDILNYANKLEININTKEIDIIYYYIKNKYIDIINGNINYIFNNLKKEINIDTYNKILELYNIYKDRINLL